MKMVHEDRKMKIRCRGNVSLISPSHRLCRKKVRRFGNLLAIGSDGLWDEEDQVKKTGLGGILSLNKI